MNFTITENSFDPALYELFEFRPRKGDIKKLQIIEAAIHCLANDGIENTTFESIGKLIGTRRSHVAYHFADKKLIFLSAIKFILSTYQQTVMGQMVESQNGRKMLLQYIEGSFTWATDHPTHLSVIFLLYYYCQLDSEYRDLHDQVRRGGMERLTYILSQKFNNKFTKRQAAFLAKQIQNLLSGAILDAATTNSYDLKRAKQEAIKTTLTLIDSVGGP
ncbi:MAG: TetR/AcrR family transcriptional regulator [Bdellovibrionales bacterium]|nr:TetR/AcrR family transcriptional regulator [Bdellovibrionales bacterium]